MEIEGCLLPEDRLYDVEELTWASLDRSEGVWTLGITMALSSLAGRFLSVSFRPLTGPLARGRSVATVESLRYTGPIRLPADGSVVLRNEEILARPKLLNDAPYDRGWVVRFRPTGASPPPGLEEASAIGPRLRERILSQRIRCLPAVADVELVEVGSECAAVLARLDEELARRAAEEVVLLVTDDPTSSIEMVRWADQTGHTLLAHRREGELHQFLVRKEAEPHPRRRAPGTGRL